jgi:hypothetical protein
MRRRIPTSLQLSSGGPTFFLSIIICYESTSSKF